MSASTISIPTADGPMPAYEAAPATSAGPRQARGGVVVIQEAFGLTDHVADVAGRFAAAGWHAVAPALFHRLGGPGAPVHPYDDIAAARPAMASLTPQGLHTDVFAALAHLAAAGLPGLRCAVVGFCMGGSVALWAATSLPIGAAVTFYGGGVAAGRFGLPPLVELAPALRAPWLGLYGDRDKGIPVGQVERLRTAARMAPVPTEVVRYPGADHGFHCDDRPAVFDPDAAADAWRRTLAWLEDHIPGPGDSRVADNPARARFELTVGGELAGFAQYRLREPGMVFTHTEVDPAYEGQGLGGRLARAALDAARERGLAVDPACPFIRAWIDKHPGYADLVAR